MRILYFSRDYTTHDRRFLAKISERHEVFFLRLEDDGVAYEERPVPDGVRVVPWAAGRGRSTTPESWLRLLPAYQEVIERVLPNLIHAGPVQSCGFMTALAGFHPFLAMSWGSDVLVDSRRDALWQWITQYTLAQCDLLACDCEAVAAEARLLSRNPLLPTVQFPWGIDLARFAPGPAKMPKTIRPGWQDAVVVISNRSWSHGYGVETLLEAFALAHDADPRLRLILAGGGPLAPVVRGWMEARGLSAAVDLPGNISNEQLPNYLRAANVYASCASSDGSSISLLEAMATGLPVVVTDLPSNREWVIQPENGWLCPDGRAQAFANALVEAAQLDNVDRCRISSNNRSVAEQRANWNLNSVKLFHAYNALRSRFQESIHVTV